MKRCEAETTFQHDLELRMLRAATAVPRVAERWRKLGLPVPILGIGKGGLPRTWAVDLPLAAGRPSGRKAFSASVPRLRQRTTPTTVPVSDAEPPASPADAATDPPMTTCGRGAP